MYLKQAFEFRQIRLLKTTVIEEQILLRTSISRHLYTYFEVEKLFRKYVEFSKSSAMLEIL